MAGGPEKPHSRYDDLLTVATELFGEIGYERTTVRMIADRLGIKSGSLYSHVPSKEHVLREIIVDTADRFFERCNAARASADSPEERLRAICRAHIGVIHDHRAAVNVYFDQWKRLHGELRDEIVGLREKYEQIVGQTIQEGIDAGVFGAGDVRGAVYVILSTLNWTYQWYAPGGPQGPDELADRLLEVILTGLRIRNS